MSYINFGDFLRHVVHAEATGARHQLGERVAMGLSEFNPSGGGFVVPEQFAAELYRRTYSTGRLLSRAMLIPMVSNELKIPAVDEASRANGSRFGGLKLYGIAEADSVTASRPTFSNLTLSPKKLMGISWATSELVNDAPALGAILEWMFSLEGTFQAERQMVSGDGAGEALGILNAPALITVAKETGQGAATVTATNILQMFGRLWCGAHETAVWLVHQDLLPQLMPLTISGTTTQLFRFADDGTPLLLGRPVLVTEYNPSPGLAGDLILADLGSYAVGDRGQGTVPSMHVGFLTDEMAFRFTWRFDGQPMWATPTTAANSNTTVSPFVALGARP